MQPSSLKRVLGFFMNKSHRKDNNKLINKQRFMRLYDNDKEREIVGKVLELVFSELSFPRALDILNIVAVLAIEEHNKEYPEEKEALLKGFKAVNDSILKCLEKL